MIKVYRSAIIHSPVDTVWKLVRDFNALPKWHPAIATSEIEGGLPADPLVMQPGQSVTFTFSQAGTFAYECHFHPQNMKGTVTVTP